MSGPPVDGGSVTDDGERVRIIGRARVLGAPGAIAAADPVEPARAARRALADAGCKAVAVDLLVVVARDEPSRASCATLARRALGPHGDETHVIGVAVAALKADEIAADSVTWLATSQTSAWTLAVIIAAGVDGTIVALCAKQDRR